MAGNRYLGLLTVVAGLIGTSRAEGPQQFYPQPPQTVCQDCVTHSCRLVPEVKQIKKTVYEVQEVPYCVKKLPPLWSLFHHHGCDCEACAECDCVRYKRVLIKKEIVVAEVCTSKCVVEQHFERVPCLGTGVPPCLPK